MASVLAFPLPKSSAIDMQQVYWTYAANLKRKDLKFIHRFPQKILLGSAVPCTGGSGGRSNNNTTANLMLFYHISYRKSASHDDVGLKMAVMTLSDQIILHRHLRIRPTYFHTYLEFTIWCVHYCSFSLQLFECPRTIAIFLGTLTDIRLLRHGKVCRNIIAHYM